MRKTSRVLKVVNSLTALLLFENIIVQGWIWGSSCIGVACTYPRGPQSIVGWLVSIGSIIVFLVSVFLLVRLKKELK